jgi:CBS domain-containing protein
VFENSTLREAADLMAAEKVGRLPVVSEERPDFVLGMLTRSDLMKALGLELEKKRK